MVKVLFVCLGNICRSPMAEGIFKQMVNELGLDIICDSAGTSSYHIGELPDERMRLTAKNHGIDLTHRARQLAQDDFDKFQYILAMDQSNYQNIMNLKIRVSSQAEPTIKLIRDFDPHQGNKQVPDPYYGDQEDFE
ncbi:MAG: low molecular weight protein-tyrosine-phosphatase, partial [Bacteroidota bacterium]